VRRAPAKVAVALAAAVAVAHPRATLAEASDPGELFSQAVGLFFDAKPAESARVFDELVAVVPAPEPEHWQRGLALYYADRFAEGRARGWSVRL